MKWIKYCSIFVIALSLGYGIGVYVGETHNKPVPIIVEQLPDKYLSSHGSNLVYVADTTTTTPTTDNTQSPVMAIIWNIVSVLSVAIGTGISALVAALIATLIKKWNLQVSADTQQTITDAVNTGIHSAEAYAANQANKPSSNDKLNFAIQASRAVLSSDIAKNVTDKTLAHFVEEAVYKMFNQPDPNDAVTPAATPTK